MFIFFQVGSGHTVSSVLNRKRSDKCSSHVIAMKSSTALSVSPSIVSTSKSAGFSCTKLSGSGDTHWVDFSQKMAKNKSFGLLSYPVFLYKTECRQRQL